MAHFNIRILTKLFLLTFLLTACADKEQEMISPSGGYQEIVLNNGSKIRLGPKSLGRYKASGKQLYLEGEAELNVAPGKTLDVLTTNGQVKAESGNYRIHSRRSTLVVMVMDGKATTSNVDGGASQELTSEMYAIYNGKNLADANTKTTQQMTNDKYWVFNSSSIQFILESISAQYGVTFEDGDANLNKVFSGFVPRDDIQIAMSILTRSLGLEYVEEGSNYVLSNAAY